MRWCWLTRFRGGARRRIKSRSAGARNPRSSQGCTFGPGIQGCCGAVASMWRACGFLSFPLVDGTRTSSKNPTPTDSTQPTSYDISIFTTFGFFRSFSIYSFVPLPYSLSLHTALLATFGVACAQFYPETTIPPTSTNSSSSSSRLFASRAIFTKSPWVCQSSFAGSARGIPRYLSSSPRIAFRSLTISMYGLMRRIIAQSLSC